MHPCRVIPAKDAGRRGQQTRIVWFPSWWITLRRWRIRHWCDGAAPPIHVTHSPLGRPELLVEAARGPAISFSEGGGKVWAALCGDASDIGIDAASADEFRGEYPLHRVFHDQELHHVLRLTGGDVANASALLWSIKEAVVKALGCAFHLVAPLQVNVYPSAGGDWRGYIFPVCISRCGCPSPS